VKKDGLTRQSGSGDPVVALPAVRQVIRDFNPGAPLSGVATIDELMAQSIRQPRSLSLLIAAFAAIALVLSVVAGRVPRAGVARGARAAGDGAAE